MIHTHTHPPSPLLPLLYSLVRLATDLLGEARAVKLMLRVSSVRPLGETPELGERPPSSPDPELELPELELELELPLELVYMREESWEPLGEGGKAEPKQGCDSDCRLLLELSLYMDTGLVRLGEPLQEEPM